MPLQSARYRLVSCSLSAWVAPNDSGGKDLPEELHSEVHLFRDGELRCLLYHPILPWLSFTPLVSSPFCGVLRGSPPLGSVALPAACLFTLGAGRVGALPFLALSPLAPSLAGGRFGPQERDPRAGPEGPLASRHLHFHLGLPRRTQHPVRLH